MKKTLLALALTIGVSTITALPSAHAAWPVFDSSVFGQTLKQLAELKKHYDLLKQQYDELLATQNAVTGSYGMGLLQNGPLDELGRREMPATWQEVVSLQNSGVIPGVFTEKGEYFKKLLPTVEDKLFSSDSNDRNLTGYKLSTDHTRAAFAATEAIYNKIQDRLKSIESLTQEIDKTDNVKQATDLNSRISPENGVLSIDLAHVSWAQLSLHTVLQNNQNQTVANQAEFFDEAKK